MVKIPLITLLLAICFVSCRYGREEKTVTNEKSCKRIVSTAPSITETLFELGLGQRTVGVSDNCFYPEGVENIDRVGKVLDLSYESILMRKPDMVIFTDYHFKKAESLKKLGVKTLIVDHSTIDGFMESMDLISRACGVDEQTEHIRNKYRKAAKKSFQYDLKKDENTKVMIVVGREYLQNGIKDVYIAGKDGFYSKLISFFEGVTNVYEGNLAYPKIQIEGIVTMAPDIIIDIVTDRKFNKEELEKIGDDWKVFENIKKDLMLQGWI